ARRLFADRSAIGRRIRLLNPEQSEDWREVVGMVADVRYSGLDDAAGSSIYTPFAQTPFLWTYVVVRTAGDPRPVLSAIRAVVASVDPKLHVARLQPMSEIVSQSVAQPRFTMLLLSA